MIPLDELTYCHIVIIAASATCLFVGGLVVSLWYEWHYRRAFSWQRYLDRGLFK